MDLDLVDALALLLGLYFGVRWTSGVRAKSRQPAPSLDAPERRVERTELRALALMTSACIAKIVLHLGVQWFERRVGAAGRAWPLLSMGIDLGWTALMFVGLWMRASARQQRARLGLPPQ
jgi:hypothetical protein